MVAVMVKGLLLFYPTDRENEREREQKDGIDRCGSENRMMMGRLAG